MLKCCHLVLVWRQTSAEHSASVAPGIRCRVPGQAARSPAGDLHTRALLPPHSSPGCRNGEGARNASASASSPSLPTAQQRKGKDAAQIPGTLHFDGINTRNTEQIYCFHTGRNFLRCGIHTFTLTNSLWFLSRTKTNSRGYT